MHRVSKMRDRIDELAGLMNEFKLSEAEMSADGFKICFKKKSSTPASVMMMANGIEPQGEPPQDEPVEAPVAVEAKPAGIPVTSPMTGIYYNAPSPSSPPFVNEGDEVTAGSIIGLIEAMKVFNEIPCPTSGRVLKVVAESGQLVNLGDPLLYVG
jgi:acetyl-CoA carboxylase biotin carboxyl carrier protein